MACSGREGSSARLWALVEKQAASGPEGSGTGTWRGPVALGEQLQHLPGALAPLQQGVARAGTRLVQLLHQGLSLLHGQLPCPAPQALQVGQQGGEVLVGDLCRRDEGR